MEVATRLFEQSMVELKQDVDKKLDATPKSEVGTWRSPDQPSVSVVIPCFNEERFIGSVLENLARQYNHDRYEILVVDGMSEDRTRDIVSQFAEASQTLRVRVVDNPRRNIPAALNLGIGNAEGDIIVRMDAHSVPSENYVRDCVRLLNDKSAAVVGMPWHIQPGADTLVAHAIALAVSHPFGIGDAKYRMANSSGTRVVDTVPFGVFRKSLWEQLGGFNEELLANEDYDFNYRTRITGGKVLLDGSGHCNYYARATFRGLASQYLRYGKWKAQMVKLHPQSIRLRHLVAPAFVLSLLSTIVMAPWWIPAAWALAIIVTAYGLLAFPCALGLARRSGTYGVVFIIPLVFLVLHISWGSSFLLGLIRHRE
jgi:cellulose synthase/poly-beta-1,6-N-acetylglucosamine synthase-like glycosyltransferase